MLAFILPPIISERVSERMAITQTGGIINTRHIIGRILRDPRIGVALLYLVGHHAMRVQNLAKLRDRALRSIQLLRVRVHQPKQLATRLLDFILEVFKGPGETRFVVLETLTESLLPGFYYFQRRFEFL